MHPPIDQAIAALASRQHGIASVSQLLALGLNRQRISRRVAAGRLHRVHRGVYAVGHTALSREARWMAAVLAAGSDAALSHRSAAVFWKIWRGGEHSTEVVAPCQRTDRWNVRVHSTRRLDRNDVVRRNGIAVTSPERTIIDLAEVLEPHQLANVMHEAAHRRLLNIRRLRAAVARMVGRARLAIVKQALKLYLGGSVGTRSTLEDTCLALLRDNGIDAPDVNRRVTAGARTYELDFCWPRQRLCLEVDGHGHRRPRTRAADEERDAVLRAHGYHVIRVTGADLEHNGAAVVTTVRAALAQY